MAYFSMFPYLAYPSFSDANTEVLVKDITARVIQKTSSLTKDQKKLFYPYVIRQGERPDTLSNNYYGTPSYFWTILITNEMHDIQYDWPMDYGQFIRYIENKYSSVPIAQSGLNYYVRPLEQSTSFMKVPEANYTASPEYVNGVLMKYTKTDYDLEEEANESKRNINLIRSEYIGTFVRLFEEQFK